MKISFMYTFNPFKFFSCLCVWAAAMWRAIVSSGGAGTIDQSVGPEHKGPSPFKIMKLEFTDGHCTYYSIL